MFIAYLVQLRLSKGAKNRRSRMAEKEIGRSPIMDITQESPLPEPVVKKPTSDRWAKIFLILGTIAPLWGLAGALGVRFGLWGWEKGLAQVPFSFFFALGLILIGIFRFWWNRRKGNPQSGFVRILAIAIALGYVGWIGSFLLKGASSPAIHDISTDLADPPQFKVLALRADNLDQIPGADDTDMKGLSPQQRWELIHKDAYGDIRTVRINKPVEEVMEKAKRLAEARGWKVEYAEASEGRMEATATTALFQFKDDVVLRVRATEDLKGSVVDMRSVSRVGVSDLGVNAERIRTFLADLSGTVSAG
jgi:uncharacterized protein (DUF1499 family)